MEAVIFYQRRSAAFIGTESGRNDPAAECPETNGHCQVPVQNKTWILLVPTKSPAKINAIKCTKIMMTNVAEHSRDES